MDKEASSGNAGEDKGRKQMNEREIRSLTRVWVTGGRTGKAGVEGGGGGEVRSREF